MSRLFVNEVAPRDGLQMEKRFVPTHEKISFVDALSDCGFAKIEVTSFASARDPGAGRRRDRDARDPPRAGRRLYRAGARRARRRQGGVAHGRGRRGAGAGAGLGDDQGAVDCSRG
jgi:isopropylmalate/homocitrate/citramalate synthase